ncbi:MAG TPA: hypothetical protein PK037_11600 [Saprospiraceae bacterium]|nr:hypothetical protein [Saprospiraceae bacterium]
MKTTTLAAGIMAASLLLASWLFANKKISTRKVEGKKNAFETYWYDGKAEVCSYDLEQNRYGEIRKGDAILIFVTEDFSKTKQVKLDRPEMATKDAVKILKLNMSREFRTGIYPYHLMSSVFTTVEKPKTIKASYSVQEWCGHTFLQFSRRDDAYKVNGNSYFEKEVDTDTLLRSVLLEDEIWTLLRIDANLIKKGVQDIIPSGITSRLIHEAPQLKKGEIIMSSAINENEGTSFLEMVIGTRHLKIEYEKTFPHSILGWQEYSEDGGKHTLVSRAKLKKKVRIPYWQLNHEADNGWRDSLLLRIK